MPRGKRLSLGGMVYHTLNRGNLLREIFATEQDYRLFLTVLKQACAQFDMRVLAYCILPTHWHVTIYPKRDGDLSRFMGWVTLTHTQRYHSAHASAGTGHLYQGRFKSFPVQLDTHCLSLAHYVERCAAKAGLTDRAEAWRWGSLWQRMNPAKAGEWAVPLADWPVARPANWLERVNQPQAESEIAAIQTSIERGRPLGDERWQQQTATRMDLEHTLRNRGRPAKSIPGHLSR